MKSNGKSKLSRKTKLILGFILGTPAALVFLFFAFIFLMKSCLPGVSLKSNYKVDTVRFVNSNPNSVSGTGNVAPRIWIDTNTKIRGLFNSNVKSIKPYSVAFYFTDSAFTFTSLEFTKIEIIYDDGIEEKATDSVQMPIKINSRKYECVNTGPGNRIVRTTVGLFNGKFSGVITRDEPFRLHIVGKFTRKNGVEAPFKIDQHYKVQKENTTKGIFDVLVDK